jgi:hypothetical protein
LFGKKAGEGLGKSGKVVENLNGDIFWQEALVCWKLLES